MKTLYVPKGKTLHYERLECQTIIADGTLVVDGAVRAKRITGKGLICTPFTGHPVEGVLLCGTHMSTKGNV